MPWYNRVRDAINVAAPFLVPTQLTNLALLIGAILEKRTLCLSELARAYPTPQQRRIRAPKHDLLHRLKRLWRFIDNERVDALAVQVAFVPHVVTRLGHPRFLGLAIDWTMFDTTLPSGERMRYQVLRIPPSLARDGPCRCCSSPTIGTACRPTKARTSWSRTRCWRSSRSYP